MNKIGFSYARVSTEKQSQSGVSIEAQHAYNLSFAKGLGVEVMKQFSELGKTGRNFNRPQIHALKRTVKKELKKGNDVFVFIYDTSRLGRDVLGNEEFRRELQKLGANVYITSENTNISNDDTFFMFGVKSLLAEQQSRDNGRRTSRGMRQVYEMGFLPLARLPFGYNKIKIGNRKSGEPNEDGFRLQKMYFEFLERSTDKNILWRKHLPEMRKSSFYDLFEDHRLIFYSGRIPIPMKRGFEKIVEGKHNGIITIEQCERIMQLNEIERQKPNDNKVYYTTDEYREIYWLKGLLWHEPSQKPYTSSSTTKPRKNEVRHYYRPQKGIGASLPVHKAHEVIMMALRELRLSEENYNDLKVEAQKQMHQYQATTHKKINDLEKDRKIIEKKIATLDANFDKYSPSIYERLLDGLNQKLSSIEEAIKNQYKLVENVDSTLLEVLDVMRSISNIIEVVVFDCGHLRPTILWIWESLMVSLKYRKLTLNLFL